MCSSDFARRLGQRCDLQQVCAYHLLLRKFHMILAAIPTGIHGQPALLDARAFNIGLKPTALTWRACLIGHLRPYVIKDSLTA